MVSAMLAPWQERIFEAEAFLNGVCLLHSCEECHTVHHREIMPGQELRMNDKELR
jgi:hypothetical protein